jgi:hypothetical protein
VGCSSTKRGIRSTCSGAFTTSSRRSRRTISIRSRSRGSASIPPRTRS